MRPQRLLGCIREYFGRHSPTFAQALHPGKPWGNAELARKEYREGEIVLESLPPMVNFVLSSYCNSEPSSPMRMCYFHDLSQGQVGI